MRRKRGSRRGTAHRHVPSEPKSPGDVPATQRTEIARFMVIVEHDSGKNPDSVQHQGSWGGKGQQTPSQGKQEKVLGTKGAVCGLSLIHI